LLREIEPESGSLFGKPIPLINKFGSTSKLSSELELRSPISLTHEQKTELEHAVAH